MKNINILLTFLLITVMFIGLNAQEKTNTKMNHSNMKDVKDSTSSHGMMHNHTSMHDSTKKEMKHEKMHDMKHEKDSIVREGKIDLSEIDMNKDGKVYQDQMCWNVISDESGRCPLCNMKLKEVSLDHAKKKLVENGFKTKD
ncbi:MAG: hypothetical protein KJ571_08840 [Bacteroidetes bacterium]|nr:hypothetical protein [Bacteroidota bacterium]